MKKKKIHLINPAYFETYCGREIDGHRATRHAVFVTCKVCIRKAREEAEKVR